MKKVHGSAEGDVNVVVESVVEDSSNLKPKEPESTLAGDLVFQKVSSSEEEDEDEDEDEEKGDGDNNGVAGEAGEKGRKQRVNRKEKQVRKQRQNLR